MLPHLSNTCLPPDVMVSGTLNDVSQSPPVVDPPTLPRDIVPDPTTSLRVLVVDDSATLRDLFVVVLRQAGHDAHAVASADAALARLEAATVDVVISDLSLGQGMNGSDLARTVAEHWPGVGFILATAAADELAQDQLEACGVDAVLSKPFRGAGLCDTVRRVALGHSWVSAR